MPTIQFAMGADEARSPEQADRPDEARIVSLLEGYKQEAQDARRSGPNGRDDVWESNWDLYWGRMDYADKADWQSTEVMPEAPQFVDRWAAAMREALTQRQDWYVVEDPTDTEGDLVPHVQRFVDMLLAHAGKTPDGHTTGFETVFEDLMKLGAIMATSATVTWQAGQGPGGGHVAVEATDPRNVWIDHTGRGLYRLRSYELDKHELMRRARQVDANGVPLYRPEAVAELERQERFEFREQGETSSGHAQETSSRRKPVALDEWLVTLVDEDGSTLAENSLIVVANDRVIVRGPEPNPFWHGMDWVVLAPMISVPFSVYGRSYMEDWSSVARSFIEMTNLILDGTFTSAMNAYAMSPQMLEDPTQLTEGVTPNQVFLLEDGRAPQDFMRELDLGSLPPEAVRVWEGLKQEMREGAKLSEIALGQVPPKGDITATEVSAVQQSSSSLVRSMARTIESRLLEPVLDMIWQTGLQHVDFSDPRVQRELGPETAQMLLSRRQEFRDRDVRFQVRGISALVDRQQKLQNMLAAINTIGSSDVLLQEFSRKFDFGRVLDHLMTLYGIDTLQLEPTERERRLREVVQTMERAQEQASGEEEGADRQAGGPGGEARENRGQPRRVRQTESPEGRGGPSQ